MIEHFIDYSIFRGKIWYLTEQRQNKNKYESIFYTLCSSSIWTVYTMGSSTKIGHKDFAFITLLNLSHGDNPHSYLAISPKALSLSLSLHPPVLSFTLLSLSMPPWFRTFSLLLHLLLYPCVSPSSDHPPSFLPLFFPPSFSPTHNSSLSLSPFAPFIHPPWPLSLLPSLLPFSLPPSLPQFSLSLSPPLSFPLSLSPSVFLSIHPPFLISSHRPVYVDILRNTYLPSQKMKRKLQSTPSWSHPVVLHFKCILILGILVLYASRLLSPVLFIPLFIHFRQSCMTGRSADIKQLKATIR